MQEIIGLLTLELVIPASLSLKDKRMIIKSIKDKVRNKFNVSIAETDYQEKWQRARLAIVQVGNEYGRIEKNLNHIFSMIDDLPDLEITNHSYEYL